MPRKICYPQILDGTVKENGLFIDPATYSFDHKKYFLNYLQFSIQSHLNRHENNTGIYTFIKKLAVAAEQSDSNKAYLDVKSLFDDKDSYDAFSNSIKPLTKEIIYHMTIYNAFNAAARQNKKTIKM